MMKSIYKRAVSAVMLILATVSTAFGANRMYCTGEYIAPGQSGEVSFALDNSEECYGFQVEIQIPRDWEFVTEGGKVAASLTDRADDSYRIVSKLIDSHSVRIGAFSAGHTPVSGTSGALLKLKVRALAGFTSGAVTVANAIMVNKDDRDVAMDDSSVTIKFIQAQSVALNQTSAELKAGESVQLTATVLPANATDKTVTWKSSNEAVATVDANGNVTAIAVGKAVITATCGSVSATCNVTVVPTPASSVTLNRTELSLKATEAFKLEATVSPETTTDKTIAWTSSNESVATVDANGNVTAIAVGNAVITATCGSVTATCNVSVVPTSAGSITLDKTTAELKATETVQLTATVLPETTTDKTVTWKSSNEAVATVDQTGKVTAISVGKAVITATCGSVSATCNVTVVPTPASSVTLNRSELSLKATESFKLEATVSPETTTDKTVTWKSSNDAVATVDANGNVKAIAVGKAVITASCGSVSATCNVTVVSTSAGSITLDKTTAELKATETVQLTATVLPETTTDKTVTWKSSNEAVATVDQTGKVTAIAVGKANITATAASGVSATCEVAVVPTPAGSIILNKTTAELKATETMQLTATILPETTTDKRVNWNSSDNGVAIVDESGKVIAVAVGKAVITASCGSASATCEVTVVPTPAESVTLNRSELSLTATFSFQLEATVSPETTTDYTVTWKSSNDAVATVDANGNVTAIAVGSAVITASCGSVSATCNVTVDPTPAGFIILNKTTAELKATETVQLMATVLPETTTDKIVTWTSSNSAVATVDQTGKVTAIAVGKANITATAASGVSATCEVTVVPTPASSVTLNRSELSLKATEVFKLEATVSPETTTDKTIAWTSSNESVATVDVNGNVKAIAVGNAVVTATCGSVSATCNVTVVPTSAGSITLDKTTAELKATETVQLTATVLPETTTDKTVTWKSSNEAVATVDQTGKVTAIAVGKANITAKSASGVSATCEITVVETPVERIVLSKESVSIKAGETVRITATVYPETATDKTVTWTSANEDLVTVDAEGNVTGVAVGQGSVTATCGGVSATCYVEVMPTPAESVLLSEHTLNLQEGAVAELKATVAPDDATYKDVVWSSSDEKVVAVSSEGVVTAIGEGTATIRVAMADDATVYDECVVTVSKESSGIDEISAGDEPCEIYDLTGVRVSDNAGRLRPGCYIVRQGTTVRKIVIN